MTLSSRADRGLTSRSPVAYRTHCPRSMWRTIDSLLWIPAFAERHEGAVEVFAKRPGYSLVRASPFFPGQISQPRYLRPRGSRTKRETARPGKKRIPAHISSRGVVKVIGAWCFLPARRSTGHAFGFARTSAGALFGCPCCRPHCSRRRAADLSGAKIDDW
jgi:hypothetical protein